MADTLSSMASIEVKALGPWFDASEANMGRGGSSSRCPGSTGVDTAEVMESDLRTSASSVPGSGSEPRLDRVCFVGGVIVADSSSTSSISVK